MTPEVKQMFSEGKSVNAVANALGTSWWEAKKLKREYDEQCGIVKMPKPRKPKRETPAEPEPEAEPSWEPSLNVPAGRMDDIFAAFTPQEKADAIANVLQARLDATLNGEEAA